MLGLALWSVADVLCATQINNSFVVQQGKNNCYGDPPACWFRGRFDNYESCEKICATDKACRSFTWVGATGDSFAYECRTRNDTVWSLVTEQTHTAGHKGPIPPFVCTHDPADCNNGGHCINGRCVCDPTWRGERCDTLNLQPAVSTGNGLHATALGRSQNTWGGSILAVDGHYHMYAAMFLNTTLSKWESSSVIVHAVATQGVQGPYAVTDIILAPRNKVNRGDSDND